MTRGNVLIVGVGIGGLATAIALRQADYDVHVSELHPDLHSSVYGVGIIQPVNALRALQSIGRLEQCLEVGYQTPAWNRMLDVDGNHTRDTPGAAIEGVPAMNGLTRHQLHKILTDKAVEEGAKPEYSKTFKTPRGHR